jgi:hypothetical protein
MFQLKLCAGAVALGLVVMAVQKVNHSVNYVPIVATVTQVSSSCKLEEVDSGIISTTTRYTGQMACDQARALKAGGGEYAGMTIKGLIEVSLTYTSPADGSLQSGSLKYAYESYDRIARLSGGERLPILAHKSDPESVAHDYGEALDPFATAS